MFRMGRSLMLPGDMHLTQLIEGDRLVDFLQVICWTVFFSSPIQFLKIVAIITAMSCCRMGNEQANSGAT